MYVVEVRTVRIVEPKAGVILNHPGRADPSLVFSLLFLM